MCPFSNQNQNTDHHVLHFNIASYLQLINFSLHYNISNFNVLNKAPNYLRIKIYIYNGDYYLYCYCFTFLSKKYIDFFPLQITSINDQINDWGIHTNQFRSLTAFMFHKKQPRCMASQSIWFVRVTHLLIFWLELDTCVASRLLWWHDALTYWVGSIIP